MMGGGRFGKVKKEVGKQSLIRGSPWALHPEKSKFCAQWDKVVMSALLFTCFVTPFEVGFMEPTGQLAPLALMNRGIDAIFLFDLCLQFFLMYCVRTRKTSIWVADLRLIAKHYLKGWFSIDFVSIFPFSDVGEAFSKDEAADDGSGGGSRIKSILKVFRCLRLLKLMRLVRASRILKRWESRISISQMTIQISKNLLLLFVSGHWMGCVWGLLGSVEDPPDETWIAIEEEKGHVSPVGLWLASMHYSVMTLTSIGYGDMGASTNAERLIGVFLMLVSGIIWASIIGGFAAIQESLEARGLEFKSRLNEINTILEIYRIPVEMTVRLRKYFHQKHECGDTVTRMNALIEGVSPTLGLEVLYELNLHWMRNVRFVHLCSKDVQGDIAKRLIPEVYAQNENFGGIFNLFVLSMGLVARRTRLHILSQGSVWGEDIILEDISLMESPEVVTLTFVEVLRLRKAELKAATRPFPHDRRIIRRCAIRLAIRRAMLRAATQSSQSPILKKLGDKRFMKSTTLRRVPSYIFEDEPDKMPRLPVVTTDPPFGEGKVPFRAYMKKLRVGGDPKLPSDWRRRHVWLDGDGKLFYYSTQTGAPVPMFESASVANGLVFQARTTEEGYPDHSVVTAFRPARSGAPTPSQRRTGTRSWRCCTWWISSRKRRRRR